MTTALELTRKIFDPVESHFTPGERSMVSWITCDNVDHERDVVVSSGVDYKTHFQANPVVLAVHDFGRWPLGKCAWILPKKNSGFNGLYAKTIFDGDEEAEKVWLKVKNLSLRGISIGFRPPDDMKPGEWGPPTREELASRPDWKGAERIIRRCVLLEYSVCSLPMNPRALVDAVNKGVHRPVYQGTKAMDEPKELEDKAETPCECGKADCAKCTAADKDPVETKAEDEETPAAEDEAAPDEDDFDEADESSLPIKTGDFVDINTRGHRGPGRVEKIHRRGVVDHVDEELYGTKDEPAARVRCYKAHGDGHVACERKMGVRLKDLARRSEPLNPPSKKSVAEIEAKAAALAPLPPLVALSEAEVQQESIRQASEAAVKRINELFGVV